MKLRWRLVLLLVAFLAVGQFLLPDAAEWGIKNAMVGTYPNLSQARVEVVARPGVKVLAGRMDRVRLHAEEVDFGSIQAASVDLELEQARLDLRKLLLDKKLFFSARSRRLEVELKEEGINRYLRQVNVPLIGEPTIEIKAKEALLSGKVTLVGREVNIGVRGALTLEDGKLKYKPERVSFNGKELAPAMQQRLLSRIAFIMPLSSMPVEAYFSKMRQYQGRVILVSEGTGIH
ncbi:DUF2993 domain-containing protein [Metallumcola ferriviriculae]|uniref:DUF2993 domain-containing protein n=1 Tax=Metallumcola ferriviriculae TaxID=3039180 RepID=A0AAU0UL72_9FIRM|nr:DUF2993 domain-containing protein [Desulfitibacteraceae bacterium MK1]